MTSRKPKRIERILPNFLAAVLLILILLWAGIPARAQEPDTLLITPTTQGLFPLEHSGVALDITYATVNEPAHVTITRRDAAHYTITATDSYGAPLSRFEMPLVVVFPEAGVTRLIGWPGPVALDEADPDADRWLVVFDAHGLYAQPAWAALPELILYLGPLEHFTPAMVATDLDWGTIQFAASPPLERSILRTEGGRTLALPTAARSNRYADRFLPEDRGNPGGFMLLGWVHTDDLPDLARALRATIPADPDLPAPGVPQSPLALILPFDCTQDWVVSWGYHHSTPQNRFAVDFATDAPNQGVYAAHAGTVFLKRTGTREHLIDVGYSARVLAADGITSTVYGHLDPAGTLPLWDLQEDDLPDFEWIEVGSAVQGQVIGVMGRTGYATGPHIHFALWSWDQSLYQPVPLGPLTTFTRGLLVPAAQRDTCGVYTP